MDKVRFGVVRTSFISDWVIAEARQDECLELIAVYLRIQETVDAFTSKHNIPYTFTSLEEMVRNPLIDAVYIVSPNFLHISRGVLCMSYGKHVLCGKSFVPNAKEVRAMIKASRIYNVTLVEAMKSTLTPNFPAVRENLGHVGTVRRYFACYCQYFSRYDKFKEGIVLSVFKPGLSSGAMTDIGIYAVYPMVILFGYPRKIGASGIVLPLGVDGQGIVNFLYGGMNVTVFYSRIASSASSTEIQEEEGSLTLDWINIIRRVAYSPHLALVMGKSPEPVPEDLSMVADKDEYYCEVAEFINLVLLGKRESKINSLDNSLITLEIIDEVRRQLRIVYPAD